MNWILPTIKSRSKETQMVNPNDYDAVPPLPVKDIPAWAYESFEGDTDQMIRDIHSVIFWREVAKMKIGDKSKPQDWPVVDWYEKVLEAHGEESFIHAKLQAEAFAKAAVASDAVREKAERATLFFFYQSSVNNRFHLTGEYENFEEFLIDRLPRLLDKHGERSDVMFLIHEFIPMLKRLGPEWSEKIFTLEGHYAKVRGALPAARLALKEMSASVHATEEALENTVKRKQKLEDKIPNIKNEEKLQEAKLEVEMLQEEADKLLKEQELISQVALEKFTEDATHIFEAISNTEVPANGPNGIRNYLKNDRKMVHFKGKKGLLKRKTIFIFEVPHDYAGAVEKGLDFVNFRTTDFSTLPGYVEKIVERG